MRFTRAQAGRCLTGIYSASVDLETDSKIQNTIQIEFDDRTLICIAHRLRTILAYDRILVLDAGNVKVCRGVEPGTALVDHRTGVRYATKLVHARRGHLQVDVSR